MNVCILYYDNFCEFEVVLIASEFKSYNVITVALEDKIYISEEKQKFIPDKLIKEINPDEVDLFIVPGGKPQYLYENEVLKDFVINLNKMHKVIGGICSGTKLLAAYDILKNKKCTGDNEGLDVKAEYITVFKDSIIMNEEEVVVDGNIVTSTGKAFIEFAFELADMMNLYEKREERTKAYNFYKNLKD
ncbi:DJ-1/PfpI family protein [Clostridium paridis]|uniref:DJ-1/PfpI family protein n=1 Tax=Clostridium paridis TaxID=2803863 RepID=A0A937FGS2_9CLOT|nr:DJ-1/PfpI family protein [Clostridium paridis]MBL4931672.1 DJ-1/PfpI family protein [Clostridium paridis]